MSDERASRFAARQTPCGLLFAWARVLAGCALAMTLSLGVLSCTSDRNAEPQRHANDTAGAEFVCTYARFSGIASSPCTYNDLKKVVYLDMRTTAETAQDDCRGMADLATSRARFQPGWTLQITSPASGDAVLARCEFD